MIFPPTRIGFNFVLRTLSSLLLSRILLPRKSTQLCHPWPDFQKSTSPIDEFYGFAKLCSRAVVLDQAGPCLESEWGAEGGLGTRQDESKSLIIIPPSLGQWAMCFVQCAIWCNVKLVMYKMSNYLRHCTMCCLYSTMDLWYFGYSRKTLSHGEIIFLRLFFLCSFRKKTSKLVSLFIFRQLETLSREHSKSVKMTRKSQI